MPTETAQLPDSAFLIRDEAPLLSPPPIIPISGTTFRDDLTNQQYHAERSHISNSQLADFRKSVPLFHALHVARTLPRPEPSDEMVLGSALHCMALEADKFYERYVVGPDCDKRSNANKQRWADFIAEHPGATILTGAQMDAVVSMMQGIYRNPDAAELLNRPGRNELSVFWKHHTGLRCKTRFDRVCDDGTIVDLKTCQDPSPAAFARDVANRGYHHQDAFYSSCYSEAIDPFGGVSGVRFITVSNKPTHECVVNFLDPDFIRAGRTGNDRAIRELLQRRESRDWGTRYPGLNELRAPRWINDLAD